MTPDVRIEGLDEAIGDLDALQEDVADLAEVPTEVERVTGQSGRGRVTASRLGTITTFNYPRTNVRPSRFIVAATQALEPRAAEVIGDAVNTAIRKRDLA